MYLSTKYFGHNPGIPICITGGEYQNTVELIKFHCNSGDIQPFLNMLPLKIDLLV